MSSPRYVVKFSRHALSLNPYFYAFDTVSNKYLKPGHKRKRNADKHCDRLNAELLKQSDAYRKAKDNG